MAISLSNTGAAQKAEPAVPLTATGERLLTRYTETVQALITLAFFRVPFHPFLPDDIHLHVKIHAEQQS